MENISKYIKMTVIAMVTVLVFFFLQGAIIFVFRLSGAKASFFPAIVVWALSASALIFFRLQNIPLSEIGFRSPEKGSIKKLCYLIPLIITGASGMIWGIDLSQGVNCIIACLFYVTAIGVSEEIFFRGIICNIWKTEGYQKAILISAALFGVCHVLQAMANPDPVRTILAICFAFFYGIAFAQIFIVTGSILPGILIHIFHDFCSFMGISAGSNADIVLAGFQTVVILAFVFVTDKQIRTVDAQKETDC